MCCNFQVREIEYCHCLREVAFGAFKRRRTLAKCDEQQPVHIFQGNRVQPVLFFMEIVGHIAGSHQLAIGVVNPTVVRTFEFSRIAALLQAHKRAAMSQQNVGKCLQLSVLVPDDDCRFVRHFDNAEISRVWQLRLMSGKNPVFRNDADEARADRYQDPYRNDGRATSRVSGSQ